MSCSHVGYFEPVQEPVSNMEPSQPLVKSKSTFPTKPHIYTISSHKKTFLTLINMPTSGYINFYVITFVTNLYNQETDGSRLQFIAEWSYCLFTEGLCCPLLAAKMMTKPSIYRSYNNLPLCYPYVSTYQHSLGQSYSLWCDFPTLLQRQTSSAMKSSVVLYL